MTILKDFELLKMIKAKSFENKFSAVFGINKERFQNDEQLKDFAAQGLEFSREVLANLLGGIGYYYGPVQIKQANNQKKYDSKFHLPMLTLQSLLVCLLVVLLVLDSQEVSFGMKVSI